VFLAGELASVLLLFFKTLSDTILCWNEITNRLATRPRGGLFIFSKLFGFIFCGRRTGQKIKNTNVRKGFYATWRRRPTGLGKKSARCAGA
jgi:hypothetical protein